MKAEDLLSLGERAKRHLRVAQALALLTKSRKPSFLEVQAATTRLQAKQPAVAMAIILAHAKRQPLHERGDWLTAATDALRAYRLGDGADQKEADLAHEHIEKETSLHKAELARLEKMRERLSLALLCVLVGAILVTIGYFGYTFVQSINTGSKDPAQATVEKTAVEQSSEKKAEENKAASKPQQNDPKQTNKDKNPVKPAGK